MYLTCPWEQNTDRSHTFKENKYAPIVADMSYSYKVYIFFVEIAARGSVTKRNKTRLKLFAHWCSKVRSYEFKTFIGNCSKASLLASFSFFFMPERNPLGTLKFFLCCFYSYFTTYRERSSKVYQSLPKFTEKP